MKKTQKKGKIQYVIPVGTGWIVKSEDRRKFTMFTDNKRDALTAASQLAKKYESKMIVYDKNGNITKTNNYSKKFARKSA